MDFQKAFDSIWQTGLFNKIIERVVVGITYDIIKSIWTTKSSQLVHNI